MAIHHLISRAVEAGVNRTPGTVEVELKGWAALALALTVVAFLMMHIGINYTYGLLVPVLTMVEEPAKTAIVHTIERYHDDESADAPLLSKEEKESIKPQIDEEVLVLQHAALTSKFRTIIKHLREKTGSKFSCVRAAGGFVIYNTMLVAAISFLRTIPFLRICGHVLEIPLAGVFCVFSTAWVQQAVAMPGKSYFQRVGELGRAGVFKKMVLPAMGVQFVETSVYLLPRQFAGLLAMGHESMDGDISVVMTIIAVSLLVFTFLAVFTLAVIPFNIALVRLQVSYLSDETDTVIPIDRSLGGAEVKSLQAAWKSFSRQGVWRLIKVWIKYALVQSALTIGFVMILIGEMKFALGPDFERIVREKIEQAHQMRL